MDKLRTDDIITIMLIVIFWVAIFMIPIKYIIFGEYCN